MPGEANTRSFLAGYERVNYGGEYLYEFGGTLYQRINNRNGLAYQVVGYLD